MAVLWPARGATSLDYISPPPSSSFLEKPLRKIAVMGSTGSIGVNALAVIQKSTGLVPYALAGGKNISLLADQAARYRPPFLSAFDKSHAESLARFLPSGYHPEILWGASGYALLASLEEIDCVLCAQAGSGGLAASVAAALAGKVMALANKESLVLAGGVLRKICAATNASILPVDSEHYALFQCLAGAPGREVKALILTASGGPFLGKTGEALKHVRPSDALRHPTWTMGAKISVDSATLMNKGLEIIEAMHLFGVDAGKIRVLVHPQSIVHSLVEFTDNSLMAQLAEPDMRLPISACLNWPGREMAVIKSLDLVKASPLSFLEPDLAAFPCLAYAMRAAASAPPPTWGGLGLNPACMALNMANENAVRDFLAGTIGFAAIGEVVGAALEKWPEVSIVASDFARQGSIAEDAVRITESILSLAASLASTQ